MNSASDDVDQLSSASALLGPVLQLLDGFAHRNRNQHRVASWWAEFNILRRCTRKLHEAIIASLESQPARRVRPAKGKRVHEIRNEPLHHDVQARALWLSDRVMPPSYIAFTKLAADNQFAPSGLFLLGILARIKSATAPLLPPAPSDQSREVAQQETAYAPAKREQDDFGVAISRHDLTLDHSQEPERNLVDSSEPPKVFRRDKKRQPPSSQDKARTSADSESRKKKKKKTGDEFSDMFSGLI